MSGIMVIGANGQLGTDLVASAGERQVISITHHDLDIGDPGRIAEVLAENRPEVIVNMAAFLNVELCEDQPAEAFAVNAIGVRNLAVEAEAAGAPLVHISTDYVFD